MENNDQILPKIACASVAPAQDELYSCFQWLREYEVHSVSTRPSLPGPNEDIPVKVSGNVRNGFTAEFLPSEVGLHTLLVEYNGVAVGGTPFLAKAFDSEAVTVTDVPKSSPGKTVTFAGEDPLTPCMSAVQL